MNFTKLLTDELGIPMYTSENISEMLYRGQTDLLTQIYAHPNDIEIVKFNEIAEEQGTEPFKVHTPLDITIQEFDEICQNEWLMPEEYKQFDIHTWLLSQVSSKEEIDRIEEELVAFTKYKMINLLRWLKYFVDTCRANNIVWGVGRGSSVASFVLYCIGVHKIHPIKYNLHWQDFLR